MSIFDAILLGLTQGLTEFLPVSSTGHLILIRDIFGITSGNNLAFDATLHLATLLAVGLYFRKDIASLIQTAFRWVLRKEITNHDSFFLQAVIVGSIPAAILGFFLQDVIENVFRHSLVVAMGLCLGTFLMQFAESRMKTDQEALTPRKGFSIGWFQALALIPGISRSGATISGGLLAGLSREQATRFAFVLSFPVLLGAGLFSLSDLTLVEAGGISYIVIGCITAFLAGLGAIHFLVEFLKRRGLSVFIWYRILLAAAIVLFSL